jgi:uncharacterized DUF497 family protein
MYRASSSNVYAMHIQWVCQCSIGIENVYYGETEKNRMIAVVPTERKDKIRVITAYDMDAGQKQDYLKWRAEGE